MGYRIDVRTIVTQVIGAGPKAVHRTHSFEPDYDWQNKRIAEHYESSGRRDTYLGDWHSHPGATSGELSRHDRAVIRKIIRTPAARAPVPLMAILYGHPRDWELTVWSGGFLTGWLGLPRLSIKPVQVLGA